MLQSLKAFVGQGCKQAVAALAWPMLQVIRNAAKAAVSARISLDKGGITVERIDVTYCLLLCVKWERGSIVTHN